MTAAAIGGESSAPPLRVLIVDGFGNHDWQRTTRLIRGILAEQPGFQTEVATAPARAEDPGHAAWRPDFSAFDVVIQTCNDINGSGSPWPEQARRDFESFVSKGGGVLVFHSGNNAFPKWDAYNTMNARVDALAESDRSADREWDAHANDGPTVPTSCAAVPLF